MDPDRVTRTQTDSKEADREAQCTHVPSPPHSHIYSEPQTAGGLAAMFIETDTQTGHTKMTIKDHPQKDMHAPRATAKEACRAGTQVSMHT